MLLSAFIAALQIPTNLVVSDDTCLSAFCRSEAWVPCGWACCSGYHKADIKVLAGLNSILNWERWGRICFPVHPWWPNSVSCDCKFEVPIALLAVSQGSLSAFGGYPHSLSHGPLYLENQQWRISLYQNTPTLQIPFSRRSPSHLRAHLLRSDPLMISSLS